MTYPIGQNIRAAEEQPIVIWVNHIKPDKQEQFEEFFRLFAQAGDEAIQSGKMGQPECEAYRNVRILSPAGLNEDGTLTYVFLADPFVEGANYEILDMLRVSYPEQEAARINLLFVETLAGPQGAIYVKQTGH